MKDCPFCSKTPDLDEPETVHPSGIYWRLTEFGREYISRNAITRDCFPCWVFNCVESAGGCGAEISGDSKEEVLEKWNRRA